MFGTLTINTGSMYSGKSTELLRQGKRHILAGNKVVFIKPSIDTRYSKNEIVSHEGTGVGAIIVESDTNLLELKEVQEADVVLIDEVQFFNNQLSHQILKLLEDNKTVYCSGLDMDFRGEPFYLTADIMARADVVNKFKAVCTRCGADATYSHKTGTDKRIEIGATELYKALCRECYHKYKGVHSVDVRD